MEGQGRKIREREISPKATLEIAILAVDKKGEKHVVGQERGKDRAVPRRLSKAGVAESSGTGHGPGRSWRGAVDVFVVWAHEDNEAWDAERQQVRAKEAAKRARRECGR